MQPPRRDSKHRWRLPLLALALLGASAAPAGALDPATTDARKVAEAMEARDDGDKRTARMTLTLKDGAGRERVRKLLQQSMDFEEGQKSLMFFESPADVRNTGLLSIDYDDGKREDDQWLYLPSLHRSTRISTSDRSGSFMGTDLTYSDMTTKDPDDYDYTMLDASAAVDGEECWLIEARPKTDKEKEETGYLKTHTWVSKSKLVPLQIKAWVKEGKKLKYIKFTQLEKIDGIWVAKRLTVRTVRGKSLESETVMQLFDVRFNQPSVTEAQFSQRRLEQGL